MLAYCVGKNDSVEWDCHTFYLNSDSSVESPPQLCDLGGEEWQ